MRSDHKKILDQIKDHVHNKFYNETTGHDWWHIERVLNNAKTIAVKEKGADVLIVQLGALLHDIADFKFNDGNEKIGGQTTEKILSGLGLDEQTIKKVVHIVDNVSFKGHGVKSKIKSLEGKIVQDADRLDALGAIGIARAFAYGGRYSKRPLYDPTGKIKHHKNSKEYLKGPDSTIHHFYEKLIHLKKLMNTKTGKKMADSRHKFLLNYLKQFHSEWDGKK